MTERPRFAASPVSIPLTREADVLLSGERLRDGRLALGTRRQRSDGGWDAGELLLLDRQAYLALAAWLAEAVEEAWIGSARERRAETLRTALDLYGDAADGAERLAAEMLRQIPPALLLRALLLLVNAIGPAAREQLIERLNRTPDHSEDAQLRRRLAEERDTFAYALAAAALYDAIEHGLAGPAAEHAPETG